MRKLLKKLFRNFYMRCIEPEEIEFNKKEYGDIDITSKFEVLYCNSFNRIGYDGNKYKEVSLLTFKITVNKEIDSLIDLIKVINFMNENNDTNYSHYKIEYEDKYIQLFIKGNINFFESLCNTVLKNHITSYIRTYVFPGGIPLSVEQRFEDNFVYTLVTPINKIDVLFIEENSWDNVIGIAFNEVPEDYKNLHNIIEFENRFVIIDSIRNLYELSPSIINNLKLPQTRNQLYSIVHTSITDPNPYDDIDEIIED